MPIQLTARPADVCFTKNPMRFIFFYSLMQPAWKLQLQVVEPSNPNLVRAEVQYPFGATSGILNVYLENIMDALVSYSYPSNVTAPLIQELASSRRELLLRWRPVYPGSNAAWQSDTQNHVIVKGGMGDISPNLEWMVNNHGLPFNAARFYPSASHRYLTWLPNNRNITPGEYGWLLYMSDISNNDQILQYVVTYKNFTSAAINVNFPGYGGSTSFKYKTFYLPFGINQCNLDPTNLGVIYYEVRVIRPAGPVVLSQINFYPDYRPYYDTMTIHYRNSMGGVDHIRLRGEIEQGASFERKDYEQAVTVSVSPIFGRNPYYESKMRLSWKGNTGYISKEHATAILDLLNSTDMAILFNSQWLPLRIKNKDAVYRSTKNRLNNFTIEFETAGTFTSLPRQITQM